MQPEVRQGPASAGGASPSDAFASVHFSSDMLPARDRLPFWREVFARKIVRVEIEPQGDGPFRAEATIRQLPGLRVLHGAIATPSRFRRTPALVADGEDSFAFVLNRGRALPMWQHGREALLGAGEAVTILHSEPAELHSQIDALCLIVPCAAVASLAPGFEDSAMRPIARSSEAARLLFRYIELLLGDFPISTPELGHLVATHIHDLVAMAIGTPRDGAAVASRRGLRAARMHAVKTDILDHLDRQDATLESVAARQRVTPRYIQMLFEDEGTTFSHFVLEARLARAHRMLIDPRSAGRTIGSIAFDCGFGDLSYFNRTFRRRFGATPSDVRAAASGGFLH
jgi:AraC-like DNA-binding protein